MLMLMRRKGKRFGTRRGSSGVRERSLALHLHLRMHIDICFCGGSGFGGDLDTSHIYCIRDTSFEDEVDDLLL